MLFGITVSFYEKTCFDRLKVFLEHAPGVKTKKGKRDIIQIVDLF